MKQNDMNIKIQDAGTDGKTANKGSCTQLAEYINHEDQDRINEGLGPLPFTFPDGTEVTTEEVIAAIDDNAKGLKRGDDKFYHLVISPSEKEILAMGESDHEVYKNGLKLVQAISNEYARNFHRDGLVDFSGLVLFWKPHFTRGNNGELQFHIHGIASRQTSEIDGKKMKISPLTNHTDTQNGPVKGGFDRKHFYGRCEKLFDALFRYERKVAESFDYQNAMAHGTAAEKAAQAALFAEENAEQMKETITRGISRRRKRLQTENDLEDLANILTGDAVFVPNQKKEDAITNALDMAGMKNLVLEKTMSAKDKMSLSISMATAGITLRPVLSDDGVEDVVFIKAGREYPASKLMSESEHQHLLKKWCIISGQKPAYLIREHFTAKVMEKEKQKVTISTKKRKGPKIG